MSPTLSVNSGVVVVGGEDELVGVAVVELSFKQNQLVLLARIYVGVWEGESPVEVVPLSHYL